jgi:cbb3-type cytochrome oxidase maturation protein
MSSVFLLIFIAFLTGAAAWLLFVWSVRSGQFDDVEGPKFRMLDEDEGNQKKDRQQSAPPAEKPTDSGDKD